MPNLFAPLDGPSSEEFIEELLSGSRFRMERIVSMGQTTPPGEWYDQERDEWVVLLAGAARIRFEDTPEEQQLGPGDYLHIAAHRRHRVEWTDPEQESVWLAFHYEK